MIKGTVVAASLAWIAETFGSEFYELMLERCPPEARALATGPIMPSSWYPVALFDTIVNMVAIESQNLSHDPPSMFFRRMVMQSGNRTLVKVYQFFLSLFDPVTVIGRVLPLMNRIYNFGRIKVLRNEPGRCVLVFTGIPVAALESVAHSFPAAIAMVMIGNGCRVMNQEMLQTRTPDGLAIEVTTKYKK